MSSRRFNHVGVSVYVSFWVCLCLCVGLKDKSVWLHGEISQVALCLLHWQAAAKGTDFTQSFPLAAFLAGIQYRAEM